MDPIRRKSGLTAEQSCRKSIYDLLQPAPQEKHAVNLLGNDLPTLENSESINPYSLCYTKVSNFRR